MDQTTRNGRILVAHDQEHMRALLRQCFEHAGYEVDAVDGELTLERVKASRPDVMIVDLSSEGGSPRAILRGLKEQEGVPPVIVLTGAPTVGNVPAQVEGAAATLSNPFTFPILLGICEALVPAPSAAPSAV
jgi:two-component system response regulator TctD